MYSPYRTMTVGECRLPCGPSGECPARGGLPHVCLAGGAGGCYPGRFGLPCTETSQCVAGFTCETVTNDIAAAGPITQKVCTLPCAADADCDTNPWTLKEGYCGGGYCQLGAGTDEHCERDAHCRTRRCQLPPAGSGTCLVIHRRESTGRRVVRRSDAVGGRRPRCVGRVGCVQSPGRIHRLGRGHRPRARRQPQRSCHREARRALVR